MESYKFFKPKSSRVQQEEEYPLLWNEESMVLGDFLSSETTINLDHYIHTLSKLKTQIIHPISQMSKVMILHSNVWHPHR
jgi:hypothetical protein